WVFPPRISRGAFSSTRTRSAPFSLADTEAASAALPAPTTTTSYSSMALPRFLRERHAEQRQPVITPRHPPQGVVAPTVYSCQFSTRKKPALQCLRVAPKSEQVRPECIKRTKKHIEPRQGRRG